MSISGNRKTLESLIKSQNNLKTQFRLNKMQQLGMNDFTAIFFQPLLNSIDQQTKELTNTQKPSDRQLSNMENKYSNLTSNLSEDEMHRIVTAIEQNKYIRNNNSLLRYLRESDNYYYFAGRTNTLSIDKNSAFILFATSHIPIQLTSGLAKLLFQYKFNKDEVTKDDVYTYRKIMSIVGNKLTKNNKRVKLMNEIIGEDKKETSEITFEEMGDYQNMLYDDYTSGEGLAVGEACVIKNFPTSKKDAHDRLKILLAAFKEGHTNVYNEINALLDYLYKMKAINKKQYRKTLAQLK